MLRDLVDKRVAIMLVKRTSVHTLDLAVVSGIIRAVDAGLVLDRGPSRGDLSLDDDILERFRPPPVFMRYLFREAELVLAVRVNRLPADADWVIPFCFGYIEPSRN